MNAPYAGRSAYHSSSSSCMNSTVFTQADVERESEQFIAYSKKIGPIVEKWVANGMKGDEDGAVYAAHICGLNLSSVEKLDSQQMQKLGPLCKRVLKLMLGSQAPYVIGTVTRFPALSILLIENAPQFKDEHLSQLPPLKALCLYQTGCTLKVASTYKKDSTLKRLIFNGVNLIK